MQAQVVQEEQRLRALADHVIHVHRHTINADRVVHAQVNGQTHLRADPIGTRHQDGVTVVAPKQSLVEVQAEHARKSAVCTDDPWAVGGPNRLGKPLDGGIASFDIYPSVGICQSTRSHVAKFYREGPTRNGVNFEFRATKRQAPRLH
jgi:hypothetical protein